MPVVHAGMPHYFLCGVLLQLRWHHERAVEGLRGVRGQREGQGCLSVPGTLVGLRERFFFI